MRLSFWHSSSKEPIEFASIDALPTDSRIFDVHNGSFFGSLTIASGQLAADTEIDARWIARVLAGGQDQRVEVDLSIPVPVPDYPSANTGPFRFRIRFVPGKKRWGVESLALPWMDEDDLPEIDGDLGEWLSTGKRVALELRKSFDFRRFGISTRNPGSPNSDLIGRVHAGLFAYPTDSVGRRAALAFVCVPFARNPQDIDPRRFGDLALARLSVKLTGDQDANVDHLPAMLVADLAPLVLESESPSSNWLTIVQWRLQGRDDAPPPANSGRLDADLFLDGGWNRVATLATTGRRITDAGQPWWPIPFIDGPKASSDVRPLLALHIPPRAGDPSRLAGVMFRARPKSTSADVHLHFRWPPDETLADPSSEPSSFLPLRGSLKLTDIRGWSDESNSQHAETRARIAATAAIDVAAFAHERLTRLDSSELALLTLENVSLATAESPWLALGSIDIKPSAVGAGRCRAVVTLRGSWTSQHCDIYPEVKLTGLPCLIRMSGEADASRTSLTAQLDVLNRTEDELQRSTGAFLAPDTLAPGHSDQNATSGFLEVRLRAERERNSLVQLRLRRESTAQPSTRTALYFQARPFTVARLHPPVFDEEAGTDFAYWRSDDTENAQWRIPDATVGFDLPPQTVAEEMERGNRFWPPPTGGPPASYIDPSKPIAFRFAPPTRVVVRPSVTERRYNKSPNNLGEVLTHARVESFQTELLYPIRMSFRRSEAGEPDIRIAELASFLGMPPPNLPAPASRSTESLVRLVSDVLPGDLGQWAVRSEHLDAAPTKPLLSLIEEFDTLRYRHSANRAHYAARTAQYHIFDPYRRDRQLHLTEGLTARLRKAKRVGKTYGAPPLLKPFPNPAEIDLSESQKGGAVLDFLTEKPHTWGDEDQDGALRAGALHTIEFPSELAAILRTPQAKSALIESLSFSTLGATGAASVSFDEGRTTFSVEIQDGQVWRLRRVRIGRIGVVCNKAKHIIVYERTVLPSSQFISQQPENATYGWPLLRKTEEYVEPIEMVRAFANEADAAENSAAFVGTSEFTSPRIYVDSAWGRDLEHGYEIPLWNRNDTTGFYPKPFVCLCGHASEGELTRAWHSNPDELVFYSNTESGGGSDPDRWDMYPGIDLPAFGPVRLPVQTNATLSSTEIVDRSTLSAPRLGPTRRRRFDFEVRCEGPVNLQHSRGDTEMLAALNVISLARTGEQTPFDKDKLHTTFPAAAKLSALTDYAADLDSGRDAIRRFIQEIPAEWLRLKLDCPALQKQLEIKRDVLFKHLRDRLDGVSVLWPDDKDFTPPDLKATLTKEIEGLAVYPARMFSEALRAVREMLAEVTRLTDDEIKNGLSRLRSTTDTAWTLVEGTLIRAKDSLNTNLQKPLTALDAGAKQLATDCDALAAEVLKFEAAAVGDLREIAKTIERLALEARMTLARIKAPQFDTALKPVRNALHQIELSANEFQRRTTDAQIASIRAEVIDALKKAAAAAQTIAVKIRTWANDLGVANAFGTIFADLEARKKIFDDQLALAFIGTATEVRAKIAQLTKLIDGSVSEKITSLEDLYKSATAEIRKPLDRAATDLQAPVSGLYLQAATLAKTLRVAIRNVLKTAAAWLDELEVQVTQAIQKISQNCQNLAPIQKEIEEKLIALAKDIENRVTSGIVSIVDEATAAQVAQWDEAFKEYKNVGARGLKLVKAIGDLPKLPQLHFNAELGEYVFDDLVKQIQTSPFAARLREIDSGLKELGLAVPARELLDQIIPKKDQIDFNKIFRDMGGLDFRKLFKRFRLKQLEGEHVKLQHGVDPATRSAWVKASVTVDYPEEQDLFSMGPLAVKAAGMSLRALSDMRISADGSRRSDTNGNFTADWTLDMNGARLVTFRQVTAQFDGGKFHFNISPDKVDLHPAMRFVSEVCKRFGEKIPPCVEVLRDSRGVPSGAKASISAVLKDLPPLGPVKIGDLTLTGGLGLSLEGGHGFVISTHFDIGSKTSPIFVQIGFLGGGAWLHAEARFIDGKIEYAANVGLALGSMQAINIAGVARGSYSFLMFAYAAIESGKGGSLRAGLSIQGSARILGIVTAYVGLLLEVSHEAGKSRGRGVLDVEVEIGRWYSVHVCKSVEQSM
jgi:hypothetical protein